MNVTRAVAVQWLIQDFPGVTPTPKGLHENEENWAEGVCVQNLFV